MEYGSTPYIGMAPKKMAAPLYVYKVICSKLCPRFSHKLLWTIPIILECFISNKTLSVVGELRSGEAPHRQVAKRTNRHFLIIVSFTGLPRN